ALDRPHARRRGQSRLHLQRRRVRTGRSRRAAARSAAGRGHALARSVTAHRAASGGRRTSETRYRSRTAGQRNLLAGAGPDPRHPFSARAPRGRASPGDLAPPARNLQEIRGRRDVSPAPKSARISHDRAKKGNAMFTLLILAAVYGGYRAVRVAFDSLRALPRCNEDMIFY